MPSIAAAIVDSRVLLYTEAGVEPWIGIPLVLAVGGIAFAVLRRVLLHLIHQAAGRTAVIWDDALVESHAFWWFSMLLPGVVIYLGFELLDVDTDTRNWVQRFVGAGMVFTTMRAAQSAVDAIYVTWNKLPAWRSRPIKGYIQVAQMFLWVVGLLITATTLVGKNPMVLVTGVGALTAVLLLVFRDTILSLTASIQLTSYDMVRVGDWISMPQERTDGDVIDVSLHTIKVQNWDKTISTIPTHKLITETFRNWRGMQESGGRRAKRSLHIDLESVRFLATEDLDTIEQSLPELAEWVATQRKRLGAEAGNDAKESKPTNIGAFRTYARTFLKTHPGVHPGMTLLVRALAPTAEGLPVEFYFFTRTTAWARYEEIQGEIVDHLLASLGEFGLSPYQRPAGSDVRLGGELLVSSGAIDLDQDRA